MPSPYSGSGRPSSAFVTNSGMSFSGYWFGPYVLLPRVTQTGRPYVRWNANASRSPAAFDAEYGLDGCSGHSSVAEPSATSPYTSSVETCTTLRTPRSSAVCMRRYVPVTSVSRNASGSWIERSTCVSAAKFTIASQPSSADASVCRVGDVAAHEA